jgi:6,7-dimethyl-8-ribityllumazine synthase
MRKRNKIIVIEARFYLEISDQLALGAIQELEEHNCEYERLEVPGILEIPHALKYAIMSGGFDGGIALGCAIKGQTDHYEHVCNQSMAGTQDIALQYNFPIGNAILTCPTKGLAEERADIHKLNFGAKATSAVLRLITIKSNYKLV